MSFSHITDDVSRKQASKKTDFTVDLIWWDSPQPIISKLIIQMYTNIYTISHVYYS